MGWLSELATVYDLIIKNKKIETKPLPLFHIANNAPLVITLNCEGKFLSSKMAERDDWQTCMPCTEKSAARAGETVAPYPLCDKLEYVAGDYNECCDGKKLEEKFTAYLQILGNWAESEFSNQKIKSVYKYVKKRTIIKDIIKKGNIPEMDTLAKIGAKENNIFIRWNVEINNDESRTWMDSKTQKNWIDFYTKYFSDKKGLCYISGKIEPVASLHPKKIRNAGDGAKLISSNDYSNYTFRGRFTDADQACQVGMSVSLKAHNALRWLIDRQGATIGNGLTIVAWSSAIEVQPQLLKSTNDLGFEDDNVENDDYYAAEKTSLYIKNRLLGFYGKINDSDNVLIMALNAATPGRMSILLYREFNKTEFFEAQKHWHERLAWFYSYWKKEEKKYMHTVSAPSPEEIVKAAYGGHVSDNAKAMTVQRLLSCIIDKTQIPTDIEQLCYNRASRLNNLDSSEREKTLETACAVIKYNLYTRYKEEYNMALDEEQNDRDYLYGRLLAVADKIETVVLEERGENRQSNAVRYMQRFAKYPYSTWKLIYTDKLQSYMKNLKQIYPKLHNWYESIIQNITDKFINEDFCSDEMLSGKFLLGYHCQQKDFWRKREKDQSIDNNKQED